MPRVQLWGDGPRRNANKVAAGKGSETPPPPQRGNNNRTPKGFCPNPFSATLNLRFIGPKSYARFGD